ETHLFDAHRNHRLNPEFPGHSRDGFRSDKPIPREKPPRTIRIIALGTSALYGIGSREPYPQHRSLNNDETITAQLQRILNQRLDDENAGFRVEVINAGVSAYRTFHHLVYLNSRLLDYKPDIVINIDGYNDFYKDQLDDPWNRYAYSTSVLVDQHNRRTLFLPMLTFSRSAARFSFTFNLAERILRRAWYRKLKEPLRSVPEGAKRLDGDFAANVKEVARRQYLRDLWQIRQLGKYAGYDHYVFLQPTLVFEPDEKLSESDKRLKQITAKNLADGEPVKMQRIRKLLPAIFQKHDIPFFDVAQISATDTKKENLYLDYCHLTPTGARITAERIAGHLYPHLLQWIRKRRDENAVKK
ncbi:MAG: hypothetical protein IID45_06775, partial [Planctomycetes bacterium]|nr:hypothetical protein [Planctomycetota bacterium]